MEDPQNMESIQGVRRITKMEVIPRIATISEINQAIQQWYSSTDEKVLIGKSGYLITNGNKGENLQKFYKTTGNINYEDIVKQRLDIIKAEIYMLIE